VRINGWDTCVVVNDAGVVLGRLRKRAFDGDPANLVEGVMESGPMTFRPDVPLDDLVERMRHRRTRSVLVTTSDGKLIGIVYRQDAERIATETLQRNVEDGASGAPPALPMQYGLKPRPSS
jgi:CBS domain-containing protein